MYMHRNNEARSCNHCCSGKEMSIIHSEWVFVALGIQHVMCLRHVILSSVACITVLYLSTLSHERNDFPGKENYST